MNSSENAGSMADELGVSDIPNINDVTNYTMGFNTLTPAIFNTVYVGSLTSVDRT